MRACRLKWAHERCDVWLPQNKRVKVQALPAFPLPECAVTPSWLQPKDSSAGLPRKNAVVQSLLLKPSSCTCEHARRKHKSPSKTDTKACSQGTEEGCNAGGRPGSCLTGHSRRDRGNTNLEHTGKLNKSAMAASVRCTYLLQSGLYAWIATLCDILVKRRALRILNSS